ncbi:glycoside hydrolase family 2 protein [Methylobacterium sp. WL6]|uniref:glycoside hydrolase family 2 protein n=1 Tax=Methylobacterium sp. WL6 TaxID=2603901 RepID=UPI0011CCBFAF|nr:glycoside hydrolase family 2 protein [Methylobacterium sp. WL6]TXN61606.1 glycoside hydrolase family 2 protein [Methylobacterium sp. WL6]
MARLHTVDGIPARTIEGPWSLVVTAPGACAGPGEAASLPGWISAEVPGTAAVALRAAGLWSEAEPTPLHGADVWYRTALTLQGRESLRFEGLATLAEIWVDGVLRLKTRSMFLAHAIAVEGTGTVELALCFRALQAELARPNRRGRWRPRLATPGALRHVRTSLLGFMPGWCPPIDTVGPYRPVTRTAIGPGRPYVLSVDLRAALDGGTGRLRLGLALADAGGSRLTLRCAGAEAVIEADAAGGFAGEVLIPEVALWWPHTHGEPRLHAVEAEIDGHVLALGRVGFRTIALERPFAEGLSLTINGVPVFCRGACWTPADLVGHSAEACRPLLALAHEAGMNMLRVSGITLYESDAFHDLCDELGILVFQDLMLANFDYPVDDPAFREVLLAEIDGFLDRTQASPSLCVLCGGSEVAQQAAMLGFPRDAWTGGLAEDVLAARVARLRPDLVVVPNSPFGGDLPFSTEAGLAHYYGVGAYRRPLEDARRAEVGFASECLAFANVPEDATLREADLLDPAGPAWAAAIPRDRGADWDFEQVRDHYLQTLFGLDPETLRRDDPDRYRALARATSAEVMEAVFGEWRRARSPTAGGLVWNFRDLAPGLGWGVVDAAGRPKSAWYALKRAFRPIQLAISDEGLNGLHLHVHNEAAAPLSATLRLVFSDAEGRVVQQAERAIACDPRSSGTWSSATLLGRFFDATGSYRFGPPAHSLAHASLIGPDRDGVLAESFHFPQGRDPAPRPIGLAAAIEAGAAGPVLRVAADRFALCVRIETETDARPADDGFHLAPGTRRRIALVGDGRPRGIVRAVNTNEIVRF